MKSFVEHDDSNLMQNLPLSVVCGCPNALPQVLEVFRGTHEHKSPERDQNAKI